MIDLFERLRHPAGEHSRQKEILTWQEYFKKEKKVKVPARAGEWWFQNDSETPQICAKMASLLFSPCKNHVNANNVCTTGGSLPAQITEHPQTDRVVTALLILTSISSTPTSID